MLVNFPKPDLSVNRPLEGTHDGGSRRRAVIKQT